MQLGVADAAQCAPRRAGALEDGGSDQDLALQTLPLLRMRRVVLVVRNSAAPKRDCTCTRRGQGERRVHGVIMADCVEKKGPVLRGGLPARHHGQNGDADTHVDQEEAKLTFARNDGRSLLCLGNLCCSCLRTCTDLKRVV